MAKKSIGAFEVSSGTVIVSDPCYKLPVKSYQGELENVKKGTWNASVTINEGRCGELIATHSESPKRLVRWKRAPFEVGVDSGQAGIFDKSVYDNEETVTEEPKFTFSRPDYKWYCMCCDRTLYTDIRAGVVPGGAVSQSGYGDGGYDCYTIKDRDGEIIAIKIVFI